MAKGWTPLLLRVYCLARKRRLIFKKGSTQYFRYREVVERIASSCPLVRGEPIFREYSYLSFIIQSFLKETDLSIKRIGIILQPQALLKQYQRFHSMDERRVILQLMLWQGSKSFARKTETKIVFSTENQEDLMRERARILYELLPMKAWREFHFGYDRRLNDAYLINRSEKRYFIFNASSILESNKDYLRVVYQKDCVLLVFSGDLNQEVDVGQLLTARFLDSHIEIKAFGDSYLLAPRNRKGQHTSSGGLKD